MSRYRPEGGVGSIEGRRRPTEEESVTAFELRGGAELPIVADLHVEITEGDPEAAAEALPQGVAEQLLEQQERLLAWLRKDDSNRLAYLTDPVGALKEAGLELDEQTLAALRERQEQAKAADVMPPGATIRSFTSEVGRGKPCREEEPPSGAA